MMRSNLVLLTTAVLVLGAGVVLGRLSTQWTPIMRPPPRPRSWLADQLKLTADQRKQMDAIWAETRTKIDQTFQSRHDLDQQREKDILALLSTQQRTAYEKINADFRAKINGLFTKRNQLVDQASDQSRALLDPGQQRKWDAMTKEMESRGRMGPPGGGPRPRLEPEMRPRMGPGRGRGRGPRGGGFGDEMWPRTRPTTRPEGGAEHTRGDAERD
jgi:hypothetical protein